MKDIYLTLVVIAPFFWMLWVLIFNRSVVTDCDVDTLPPKIVRALYVMLGFFMVLGVLIFIVSIDSWFRAFFMGDIALAGIILVMHGFRSPQLVQEDKDGAESDDDYDYDEEFDESMKRMFENSPFDRNSHF